MPLDDCGRQLCEQLLTCQDDAEALALAEKLRLVLREQIEQLRSRLVVLPRLGADLEET